MKSTLVTITLFACILVSAHCETADDISRITIRKKVSKGVFVPHIGESEKDKEINRAIVESSNYLLRFMLSDQASERLRLSYALSIISSEIPLADTSTQEKLRKDQMAIGKRLSQLSN